MEMQPSPQGIAALYMGNPGALQKKVQKEQQANPGLPPDLKNLLALNIVTNEADAAKRQQAMNALNQMAPGGQQPPTVAQSLQEQAKQKLQAQMLMQQRQQQGLAALAKQNPDMGIPENVSQPAQQPQGIDELPVDMEFAGGGIVAFAAGGEYETPYDRMNRENREAEARRREALAAAEAMTPDLVIGDGEYYAKPLPPEARATSAGLEKLLKFASRNVERDPETGELVPKAAPKVVSAVPAGGPDLPRGIAGARRYPGAPEPDQMAVGKLPQTPSAKAATAGIAAPAARAAAAPADVAAPATPAKSLEDQLAERLRLADAQRDAETARYAKAIPKPDTSQYDRLISELEGRRKQFDAPEKGWDSFVELMGQIAAQGPQRSWAESGAKGAAAQTALDKDRKTQQFELTKQMVDIAQKKIDADRAYNKELYATGDAASKRIDAITKELAQEAGLDRRKADELANAIKVANIHKEATLGSARIGAAARAQDPDKQTLAELKALQTSLKDQLKDPRMMGPQGAQLRSQLAQVNTMIAQMAGLGTISAAPGAQGPGGTMTGWGKAQVVK